MTPCLESGTSSWSARERQAKTGDGAVPRLLQGVMIGKRSMDGVQVMYPSP